MNSLETKLSPFFYNYNNENQIKIEKNRKIWYNNKYNSTSNIKSGKIGGYAADVISVEPMLETNPLWGIKDYPNLILTPHIAWATAAARKRLQQIALDNVQSFINGNPINVVNRWFNIKTKS